MVKPSDTSSPLFPPAPPTANEWEILRKDDLSLSLSSVGSISSAPSPSKILARSLGLRGPLGQTQGGSGFDLEAILARDFGANAAATKTPRSIRLDDEQRRLLEELYLQVLSSPPHILPPTSTHDLSHPLFLFSFLLLPRRAVRRPARPPSA
jgi:hypothetical protein